MLGLIGCLAFGLCLGIYCTYIKVQIYQPVEKPDNCFSKEIILIIVKWHILNY